MALAALVALSALPVAAAAAALTPSPGVTRVAFSLQRSAAPADVARLRSNIACTRHALGGLGGARADGIDHVVFHEGNLSPEDVASFDLPHVKFVDARDYGGFGVTSHAALDPEFSAFRLLGHAL